MFDARQAHRIPVTVLTGFLGSGKTTLLNYILKENHGLKIAVIENEFGEIGIDGDLVIGSTEEIFEMTNGCVCCVAEARDDLLRVVRQLLERPQRLDMIIIETSGLADPYPVAQTFFLDDPIRAQTYLDGVVTLVDAKHIGLHLDEVKDDGIDNQAVDQIVCADRVVLNKADLVDEAELAQVRERIRKLNETADVVTSHYARVDLKKILGLGAFDRNRQYVLEGALHDSSHDHGEHHDHGHDWSEPHEHRHDPGVSSVGIEMDGHIDPVAMRRWIAEMQQSEGEDLFRMKGIFSIKDDDFCYVLHGVHKEIEFRPNHPWNDGDQRRNKIVFIGRNLDRAALNDRLAQCLVGH
ncbi:CobW family GTP-binding protein [Alcaligenes sp. WGS1538]|uniref:CobW family GTP-binding protein n=1 Tax=Alcaligenes sp. WGS1538 TaxID=3366811 RepID=UPI00372D3851